jgi:chromate transporter
MARNIQPTPLALLVGSIAFVAIGVLAWPLVPVVSVLVPLSVAAAALERRA